MSTTPPPTTPPSPTMLPGPSTLLPAPKPMDTSADAWLGWRTWKTSEQRLETLRAAISEDPALVLIREYAQTSWPDNKQRTPEPARPYWAYREEVHAQDGLVFRSNKRLMGRQTRTLLPVPTEHLEPETIPSKDVHDRFQVIRRQQKASYDRNARNLCPLMPGQRVTTYDTLQRTWSPAMVLRPAEAPRSVIVKTEDGRELRRTREHLREAAPEPGAEATSQRAPEDSGVHEGQQQLRRSSTLRHEPCRYPLPGGITNELDKNQRRPVKTPMTLAGRTTGPVADP
ncbi:uncharacterized protein LOC119379641 [Rhipicephalus sanguineus]|uniref:uncharacterized protein LOC119379641 n=1 Tax=Rhipicephalus sanguineus TaxID=34632 RepID=UPI0020C47424|nr:uncharacterized protein LOC119379641 [Rhipicephalus sanguineus]